MGMKQDLYGEEKGGGDTLRSKPKWFGNHSFDRSLPFFNFSNNTRSIDRLRRWAIVLLIIGAVAGATMFSAFGASMYAIQSYGTIVCNEQIDRFDLNHDGRINIIDVAMVVSGFGSRLGDEEWSSSLDFNGDGQINEVDLSIVVSNCWRK